MRYAKSPLLIKFIFFLFVLLIVEAVLLVKDEGSDLFEEEAIEVQLFMKKRYNFFKLN